MSNDWATLPNLIINGLIAFGTVAVAVMAVWADEVTAWLRPPRLQLGKGSLSQLVEIKDEAEKVVEKQRYYLIPVSNAHRTRPAHEVRVMLTCLEEERNGKRDAIFTERVPLRWERQEAFLPYTAFTVGPDWYVALFYIRSDGWLVFTPQISLIHLKTKHRRGPLWVRLRAMSVEKDTECWYRIDWNGEWTDGEKEIQINCRVEFADASVV